jgi:hypothetical protein
MKIDEIILELTAKREQYGNLDVVFGQFVEPDDEVTEFDYHMNAGDETPHLAIW